MKRSTRRLILASALLASTLLGSWAWASSGERPELTGPMELGRLGLTGGEKVTGTVTSGLFGANLREGWGRLLQAILHIRKGGGEGGTNAAFSVNVTCDNCPEGCSDFVTGFTTGGTKKNPVQSPVEEFLLNFGEKELVLTQCVFDELFPIVTSAIGVTDGHVRTEDDLSVVFGVGPDGQPELITARTVEITLKK
jgi:hypothetical protein